MDRKKWIDAQLATFSQERQQLDQQIAALQSRRASLSSTIDELLSHRVVPAAPTGETTTHPDERNPPQLDQQVKTDLRRIVAEFLPGKPQE